jgi:23S rRNA pseudouridine1911/1915/1917 synthase
LNPTAYTIDGRQAGASLVEFLAQALDLSRGRAKAIIDTRCVFVNRRRVWMAKHIIQKGDLVEIVPDTPPPAPRVQTHDILYEDADYLVVNKPPAILSNGADSLESVLQRKRGEPALQAVHRLDRDTSGCLLFARSPEAFQRMVEAFQQGKVRKTYDAIVHGRFPPQLRLIDAPVEGLPATTHVRMVDGGREATHLRVRIDTGRTHQIRIHLALKHHAVVGDRQYATQAATDRSLNVRRQMLHASELAFQHPVTGQPVLARAPLPRDFLDGLHLFRLK